MSIATVARRLMSWRPTGAPMIRCSPLTLEARLQARRRAVRYREFDLVGRLSCIVFDPRGMNAPEVEYEVLEGNKLDWEIGGRPSGIWLGLSKDQQDLLICGPVPAPPQLRDTRVYPPRMMPQLYSDRSQVHFRNFVVIQPVCQLCIQPRGVATLRIVPVTTGFDGTQMSFLIDPLIGEGHLVGGHFQL
jgi:hypothetical protein